jgi:hypothetical protein
VICCESGQIPAAVTAAGDGMGHWSRSVVMEIGRISSCEGCRQVQFRVNTSQSRSNPIKRKSMVKDGQRVRIGQRAEMCCRVLNEKVYRYQIKLRLSVVYSGVLLC